MPKASKTVYMSNIRVLHFYQYICGQFHKTVLQRYDIFTTYLKNFDMETLYPVFVGQLKSSKIPYNLMRYFKYKKQRAIILKIGSGGLWFLCGSLLFIKVYLPTKFHADIFCSH